MCLIESDIRKQYAVSLIQGEVLIRERRRDSVPMRREIMYWNDFLVEDVIKTSIRFDKDMETVYDLSYFLVDFQAVINNLTDMIRNQEEIRQDYIPLYKEELFRKQERNYIDSKHPEWQQEIERNMKSMLFQPERAIANRKPNALKGLKQTTRRSFNEKYRMNMQLRGFSKGSLILDIVNSVLVGIISEFLKELLVKKTGNDRVININIENSSIHIEDSFIKMIPKNSCMGQAIKIDTVKNAGVLDVQKCAHDIVESAKPDENIEESVKRFLVELCKNNLISEDVIYDSRGIKTAVNDIKRFSGHFVDIRV